MAQEDTKGHTARYKVLKWQMEKELATWPVRKNLGIFNLLVTEHNAGKKNTTKKCVTAGKFHCKLEWIFVEEDR